MNIGNAICGIGWMAGPSITRKYPRCWQNVASFRCVKPPARIRADPCISKNEKLSKSKKRWMYGANGSFMKLRLLLFRRVFLLHIKIPTHPRAFSARLLDRISHVCFDSARIKSIGKDVEKERKKGKSKIRWEPVKRAPAFRYRGNLQLLIIISY